MINLNLTRTPEVISKEIIDFCKSINKQEEPIYLDILSTEQAIENDCFINVQKQIDDNGGNIKYGWLIAEWAPVMLEAVFHAVWMEPETNKLVDVSPLQGNDKVLFLPDDSCEYKGKQINNIKKALRKDTDIDNFIKLGDEYFEEENKDELADYHGYLILTDKVKRILEKQRNSFIKIVKKYNPDIFA